ncbi:MAG: hypothetical protein ACRD3G_13210 [Vicinamibacterales bacterium]
MKQSFVIVALLTVLVASRSTSARQTDGASLTDRAAPNFSGTYVDSVRPASCAVALKISAGRALALYVAHVRNKISLRVAPSGAFRVVPIEKRDSSPRHSTRRNGLARWEGDALVVETPGPAFPLWGDPQAAVPGSRLTESFARIANGGLIYRAWYALPDDEGPREPFEIRLAKCGGRRAF